MKFKTGGLVYIKDDLKNKYYDYLQCTYPMLEHKGTIKTIRHVDTTDNTILLEGLSDWWWNNRMVIKVKTNKKA